VKFPDILAARVRGFRVINLVGWGLLLTIALSSYTLKIFAGAQDAGAAAVEDQIQQEQKRIRMLRMEVAKLSSAPRVEALSRQYLGLTPPDSRREIAPSALASIAAKGAADAVVKISTTPEVAAPDNAANEVAR